MCDDVWRNIVFMITPVYLALQERNNKKSGGLFLSMLSAYQRGEVDTVHIQMNQNSCSSTILHSPTVPHLFPNSKQFTFLCVCWISKFRQHELAALTSLSRWRRRAGIFWQSVYSRESFTQSYLAKRRIEECRQTDSFQSQITCVQTLVLTTHLRLADYPSKNSFFLKFNVQFWLLATRTNAMQILFLFGLGL